MICDVGEVTSLDLRHNSLSNLSIAFPTSQLILQPFCCFTFVTVHSPTLLSLLLRHEQSSFSNLSVTSPTSQLILQPCRRFAYVIAHSPTLPLLHLRHSPFSNPSFASPTSQVLHLIHLTRAHSLTFPSLHLRHNSFSNPSVALPTSLLNLQPFSCFTYVTVHSPTVLSLLIRHRLFTYVI